ncbi:hypothetical protein QBC40DRAFT_278586 [Triangularia verruculosa]|uniref:Uncharacterized protein n=1 Tax=Triangularia verruculosa TaxID=2587418 RepID=A0AAN7AXW2_9PEZI|nr:hypothetical protein QBC40DRAFT_278586 [Triangularia verruculosa]
MADIYRCVHLVIITANSPGDTLGFLTTRELTDVVRLPLPQISSPSPVDTTAIDWREIL